MTDDRLDAVLGSFYRDTALAPADLERDLDEVMERVGRTGQRGRWWPLPAFGRPLSALPGRELAPVPIPTTNGRTRQGGSTMFSALKLIAATVIVALFGGFLLGGVLTTPQGEEVAPAAAVTESPSPMTTDELLSGMVTEEVEPGLFRVVNDGVRSLSSTQALRIAAGHDGNIRLLDHDGGFYRLGSEEYHEWPDPLPYGYSYNTKPVLEVAPDGTMWVIPVWSQVRPDIRSGSPLRSSDGEEWTVQPCPEGSADCGGVTVAPDGTVWASWEAGDGVGRVGHLGPTGWQALDGESGGFERMAFTDAGDLYGIVSGWAETFLDRYADGVWQHDRVALGFVDVGLDGTIWSDAGPCGGHDDPPKPCGQDGLARFAGGEWEDWTSADLPEISLGFGHDGEFQVAPDGSLWFSLWRSADGTDPRGDEEWQEMWDQGGGYILVEAGFLACDGLARFDGETLRSWLPAACVSMDISADGSVWVLADGGDGNDLYVITPEAVTASQ